MNRIHLLFIFLSILLFNKMIIAQNIHGVRYQVVPEMLIQLARNYPDQKENIEQKMKESVPGYVDYIRLDSSLIQVYWNDTGRLIGVKVHSAPDRAIYFIDSTAQVRKDTLTPVRDTLEIKLMESSSEKNITLLIQEPLSIPVQITYQSDSFYTPMLLANFLTFPNPEIAFILQSGIYPDTMSFGYPLPIMLYYKTSQIAYNRINLTTWLKFAFVSSSPNSVLRECRKHSPY
ncbi:MAG: hypothetical protein GC180_00340 [Bacteroidetes bacterium]|nr:hypothetical protein [Bacteroidota bacterium]